jgi:hypothetical protein
VAIDFEDLSQPGEYRAQQQTRLCRDRALRQVESHSSVPLLCFSIAYFSL